MTRAAWPWAWLLPACGLMPAPAISSAQPATVYRCGNAYSQAPCPQARVVEVDDPRTSAQRADAERVAAEAKQSAAAMQRERLAEAARLKPVGAGRLSAPLEASTAPTATAAPRHLTRRARRAASAPGRAKKLAPAGAVSFQQPRSAG